MKLIDLLKEIGDASSKQYSWKQTKNEETLKQYDFETDSGLQYKLHVIIDQYQNSAWIGFGTVRQLPDEDYEIDYSSTNRGELYRVMSTVVSILKDFFEKNKEIKHAMFSVEKMDSQNSKRGNLYTAYIKKFLPNATVRRRNKEDEPNETISIEMA